MPEKNKCETKAHCYFNRRWSCFLSNELTINDFRHSMFIFCLFVFLNCAQRIVFCIPVRYKIHSRSLISLKGNIFPNCFMRQVLLSSCAQNVTKSFNPAC